MFPRVTKARPLQDYRIEITFNNNESKIFDVKPYLEFGIFKQLKDYNYFNTVEAENGTVVWKNGQDFCPDTLYIEGENISESKMNSRADR